MKYPYYIKGVKGKGAEVKKALEEKCGLKFTNPASYFGNEEDFYLVDDDGVTVETVSWGFYGELIMEGLEELHIKEDSSNLLTRW